MPNLGSLIPGNRVIFFSDDRWRKVEWKLFRAWCCRRVFPPLSLSPFSYSSPFPSFISTFLSLYSCYFVFRSLRFPRRRDAVVPLSDPWDCWANVPISEGRVRTTNHRCRGRGERLGHAICFCALGCFHSLAVLKAFSSWFTRKFARLFLAIARRTRNAQMRDTAQILKTFKRCSPYIVIPWNSSRILVGLIFTGESVLNFRRNRLSVMHVIFIHSEEMYKSSF